MTKRAPTVLLTGATGYLGTLALARMLTRPGVQVVCPVRARDEEHARERLGAVLGTLWTTPSAEAVQRTWPVAFDLERPEADLPLMDEVTHVLHCAASIRFDLPLRQARRANVATAAVVTDIARRAPGLQRIVHVSTAYVAGTHRGRFRELDLDVGQEFRNSYERTKFEAEGLLRGSAGDLPLTIARPSIVVGEAGTGWTTSFNVIYPLLRAYSRGLVRELPATPHARIDVVTGDYVADGLVHLLLDAEHSGGTYHLVAGDRAPTVAELRGLTAKALGLAPVTFVERSGEPGPLDPLTAYLDVHTRFDDRAARVLLGPAGIEATPAPAALAAALAYAQRANWGRTPLARDAATNPEGRAAA
jgi:thioester reductase-like protein